MFKHAKMFLNYHHAVKFQKDISITLVNIYKRSASLNISNVNPLLCLNI